MGTTNQLESDTENPQENIQQGRRSFLLRSGVLTSATLLSSLAVAGAKAGPDTLVARRSVTKPGSASDIVYADATQLSAWIKARQVSCREVMSAFLAHIDRINPKVNAIVSLQERDGLLRQADERDRQLAGGRYLGWMHGFPQAPKDLTATAGILTTMGSPLYKNNIPKSDSILVERVRRSGAILIGKTNTPEFGLGSNTYNTVFGTTFNSYDQSRVAGGSSGGASVSVSTRMLPVADGSDMMGSLRNPTAYNNVFGLRPSQGRVPSGTTNEIFFTQLSTQGPIARTVSDLAMLLSVHAGADSRLPMTIAQDPALFTQSLKRDFKGVKIGWLGDYSGYLPMEDGVMTVCRSALKGFEAVGCVVDETKPDYPMAELWKTWLTLRNFFMASGYGALYADPAKREQLKPELIWEIEGGQKLSAADIYKATVERSKWYAALHKLFQTYDYLVLPSAQVFPFDANIHWPKEVAGKAMDTYHRWMEIVIGGTLSGLPVLNVPAGFSADGLPMGLQIIGKAQADLAVLQMGYAYEQATGWVQKRKPPILG